MQVAVTLPSRYRHAIITLPFSTIAQSAPNRYPISTQSVPNQYLALPDRFPTVTYLFSQGDTPQGLGILR